MPGEKKARNPNSETGNKSPRQKLKIQKKINRTTASQVFEFRAILVISYYSPVFYMAGVNHQ
jgi:hypothetical protein